MANGGLKNDKLLYTVHGKKKPQGELAMVNTKPALAYVQGNNKNKTLVGYTYLEEMLQKACTCKLPSYTADF